MTLIETVQAQSARLAQAGVSFGHGTTNAFDEAAWLVQWALGLPLDALDAEAERPVSANERMAVEALIGRRIRSRVPAAYLTQEAWLQGVPFYVDERAIVPRSFIAELIVDGTLDAWLPRRAKRALDLCTGNGSLAVIAAMAYPEIEIDAADISRDALALARVNVARHGFESRIRVLESDLFTALPGRYDLILCNPPYVNDESMGTLPAEYLAEPKVALAGGRDGMDLIRRIVADAPDHMTEDAVLVLEVGHERAHFEAAFPRLECAWLETSAGEDAVVLIERRALAT